MDSICDKCKFYGNEQSFHICYLSDDVLTKKKKRCKNFDERTVIPGAYESPDIMILEEIIQEEGKEFVVKISLKEGGLLE